MTNWILGYKLFLKSFQNYWIELIAIIAERLNRISEGRCLINGFLILKWKYWAAIINIPRSIEGIWTKDECQIPVISNVANAILDAPTKLRVKSLNPNCLNSLTTLSNLKIQTYATDRPKVICVKVKKIFSIIFNC